VWYGCLCMGREPDPHPINVTALGRSACGTVVWRMGERLHVTVIVKASFDLDPDGPMRLSAPEDIIFVEVHNKNNPTRSVRLTQDIAPYLPRADVLLTGHACAPEGSPVEALSVRLAVFRGVPLLDKTIHVRGDLKDDKTVPFERIPLLYERAYGGIGFETNPLGTGFGAGTEKKRPNLLDPVRPERPACFAPLSRGWSERKRLLGGADRRAIDRPIMAIPTGFDWSYFQAAPEDQRIDHLKGDEWIILDGVHPTHGHLQSHLPSARGLAGVYGMADAGDGHPLALAADTLRIDADQLRCSVVWRGSFPIPHEEALAAIRILGGVETALQSLTWPRPSMASARPSAPEIGGAPRDSAPRGGAASDQVATIQLDDAPDAPEPAVAKEPAEAPEDVSEFASTLSTITVDDAPDTDAATAPRAVVPFRKADPESNEARPQRRAERSIPTDTITLPGEEDDSRHNPPPPSLPFQRSPPPPPLASPEPESSEVTNDVETVPAPIVRTPKKASAVFQGIELVNETALAFGVVPWAMTPARDCLTIVAKATCDLVAGAPAALRAEAEPLSRDHFEDGACVYPSDFSLFKVRADVTLAGRAYAPGGAAKVMEVLFRFGDAENGFVRRVLVFGARRWEKGLAAHRPSAPEPWDQMPLRPERAFGGPRFGPNPAGIGFPDPMRGPRGLSPLPNLEDPSYRLRTPNQTPPPAFFSPIPLAWKERWASRGRSRSPWPCLPEELDWTHFQSAPRPQQLAFLRGDEPFAISGVHPQRSILEGALPGIRARCFAAWAADHGGAFEEVALYLDTVVFEVDRRTLSVVFRGTIGVPDERVPEIDALYLISEPTDKDGVTLPEARSLLLQR
jgi:hypothetical protein